MLDIFLCLQKNLVPIGQLDNTDYVTEFVKSSWKIVKVVMVVAHVTKSGTL